MFEFLQSGLTDADDHYNFQELQEFFALGEKLPLPWSYWIASMERVRQWNHRYPRIRCCWRHPPGSWWCWFQLWSSSWCQSWSDLNKTDLVQPYWFNDDGGVLELFGFVLRITLTCHYCAVGSLLSSLLHLGTDLLFLLRQSLSLQTSLLTLTLTIVLYFIFRVCSLKLEINYYDKPTVLRWPGRRHCWSQSKNILFFPRGLGLISVISRFRKPELKILSDRPHKIIKLNMEKTISNSNPFCHISINNTDECITSLCQFSLKCPFWLFMAEGGGRVYWIFRSAIAG